jgi:hypothetical protein
MGLVYLVFRLGRTLLLLSAFTAFAGFIGCPQQIISHCSQPQGSSTKTTNPQSSHSYLSPSLFAKNKHQNLIRLSKLCQLVYSQF